MPKLSELVKFKLKPIPSAWAVNREEYFKGFSDKVVPYVNQLTDKTSYVGIEIEVENVPRVPDGNWPILWRTEEDRSLRNSGIEFISLALKGEQIPYALLSLCEALPNSVQFSGRTSVHVHLNVQDKTPEEIAKIVLTYLPLERLLFAFAGEHREKNIFCVPLYDIEMTDNLFSAIKKLDTKEIKQLQSENYRYSALNLGPVTTFGTMEFRHLGGTKDVSRILTWINLILSIQKYALSTNLDELIKEIIALNTNSQYRNFAQKIFGSLINDIPCEDLNDRIAQGVLSVKRSLFSDGFYNELCAGPYKDSPLFHIKEQMNKARKQAIYSEIPPMIWPQPRIVEEWIDFTEAREEPR